MPTLETRVACAQPDKLMLKLCKHFRHKVPARFDATQGEVDFQPGLCHMTPAEGELLMRIEGPDAAALARARGVIDAHLPRFLSNDDFVADWRAPVARA